MRAGEEIILPSESDRAVILPMSGWKSKFTIGGTPSMGGVSDATMLSGASAARLFTSRYRPAWSSWWRLGCWILPSALEWRSVHREWR
jgi:hypothetical protein